MKEQGVILYGPPAVGKDTITAHLVAISASYVLFPRLKVGPGRTTGYRMATPEALERVQRAGDMVWKNARYGAVYVVDRPELKRQLGARLPVLHLGQPDAIGAVREATADARWLVVALSCPWDVAKRRIMARETGDTQARLQAWRETPELPAADLRIDTHETSPMDAAQVIDEWVRSHSLPPK
jgi:guanylate kinase